MSVMFSSPGFISMFIMGIILIICIVGSIVWAIIHISKGKFHEEYQVAVPEHVTQSRDNKSEFKRKND